MTQDRATFNIRRIAPIALLAAACFLAGAAAVKIYLNRGVIIGLTFDAYLARFQAMTSAQSAPPRYYVLHERGVDFAALAADPVVLAVTPTPFAKLTAIDLAPGNDPVIERIRTLDGVHRVVEGNIPLFCH